MTIRVFITGGTFDKSYDEISGKLDFKDTHIQEMLRLGRCRLPVEVRTLMMLDSLEMTDADRQLILGPRALGLPRPAQPQPGTGDAEQTPGEETGSQTASRSGGLGHVTSSGWRCAPRPLSAPGPGRPWASPTS